MSDDDEWNPSGLYLELEGRTAAEEWPVLAYPDLVVVLVVVVVAVVEVVVVVEGVADGIVVVVVVGMDVDGWAVTAATVVG